MYYIEPFRNIKSLNTNIYFGLLKFFLHYLKFFNTHHLNPGPAPVPASCHRATIHNPFPSLSPPEAAAAAAGLIPRASRVYTLQPVRSAALTTSLGGLGRSGN